jgi:hypothetical protein
MPDDTGAPWLLPFPVLTDQPNGPESVQDLAEQTATMLGRAWPCTSATRPAHSEGLHIWETDTEREYISNGTAWLPVAQGDDTGWVDGLDEGWSAAANFTLTSIQVRRCNGTVSFYANLTSTNALSAGDIANVSMLNASANWIPDHPVGGIGSGQTGPGLFAYITSGGVVTLTALATALGAGGAFSVSGTYLL